MVSMDFVLHCIANEIMRFSPFMFEYQVRVCRLCAVIVTDRPDGRSEIQNVRISIYSLVFSFLCHRLLG